MTKQGVIRCILSILLMAYLVVALSFTTREAAADPYRGIKISIIDGSKKGFVTPADIEHELGDIYTNISRMRADSVNTLNIERRILAMDNIESVNCMILNNHSLLLEVYPLEPVARVFDTASGRNYYINRAGKKMRANARYRLDAPVVVGRFNNRVSPTDALPVIDFVNSRGTLSSLVSSFRITPDGDILLIPRIRGHVVNFGDSTDIANKFDRLLVFYNKVMPVKGWEYYDTLSVKWRNQVVAKRRNHSHSAGAAPVYHEEYIDDSGTMLTAVINPSEAGQ